MSFTIHREYSQKSNIQTLKTYHVLLETFTECQRLVSGHENIFAIFFHDIQRIISNFQLLQLELAYNWPRPDLLGERNRTFPFIDYHDILHGIDVSEKEYAPAVASLNSPMYLKGINLLSRIRNGSGPKVGLLHWGGCGPSAAVIGQLLAKGYRINFPDYAPLPKLPFEPQWQLFSRIFDIHAEDLDLHARAEGLKSLIKNHILAQIGHEERPLSCDILVSKFLSSLSPRATAVQARRQGLPVVAMTISEAEADLDEPVFGYGERTFATHVLGYGQNSSEIVASSRYLRSLFEPEEKIVHHSGDAFSAKRLYQSHRPIQRFSSAVGKKLFYVPTGISGFNSYGPFRSLPDLLYTRWKKRVMDLFPTMILKDYPNNTHQLLLDLPSHRVNSRPFEEVIHLADGFLFDHVSTALHLACMTDKPIVLFEFGGVDNHSPSALDALKARCIHLPIDDLEDDTLKERIMAHAHDDKTNHFTPVFSLNSNGTSRINALLSLLGEMDQ